MRCQDCDDREPHAELNMVSADLGEGAFLAVLCDTCWHRRQYRADLLKRRAKLGISGAQLQEAERDLLDELAAGGADPVEWPEFGSWIHDE